VGEHVDHAARQAGEGGFQVHRHELDLRFVSQRSRGDRLAQVDVEPGALARVVFCREARRRKCHAAFDDAMRLDVVEHVGSRWARQRGDGAN
jgi:hypothetical protein